MLLPTILELSDVPGRPRVRKDLPGPLRIGDRVRLAFRLARMNGGRSELLEVKGEFKVGSVSFDGTDLPKQLLQVEAVGKAPSWQAVKKIRESRQRLSPACAPRTTVA